jgi:hypothetical protein
MCGWPPSFGTGPFHPHWSLLKLKVAPFDSRFFMGACSLHRVQSSFLISFYGTRLVDPGFLVPRHPLSELDADCRRHAARGDLARLAEEQLAKGASYAGHHDPLPNLERARANRSEDGSDQV